MFGQGEIRDLFTCKKNADVHHPKPMCVYLLEIELYFDKVFHADLCSVVDNELVVVERVALGVCHASVGALAYWY